MTQMLRKRGFSRIFSFLKRHWLISRIGVPTALLRSSNKNPRKSAFAQHPRHPRPIVLQPNT
jgi:hypothetical protein